MVIQKNAKKVLQYSMFYLVGIAIITIPTMGAFLITGTFQDFIFSYFTFNALYSYFTSISGSIVLMLKNCLESFPKFKLPSILIMIGLVRMVVKKHSINIYGRLALLLNFCALTATTYVAKYAYLYYYLLISVFALFGVITIAQIIAKILNQSDIEARGIISTCIVCMLLIFFVNSTPLKSYFFDKEPVAQDVLSHDMKLRATTGDVSFFEYDMLEYGFVSQAKSGPYVRYFFYPNIKDTVYSGVRYEQLSYIQNRETEYIVFQRFAPEDYPSHADLDANYQFCNKFTNAEGVTYMIYQRKHQ